MNPPLSEQCRSCRHLVRRNEEALCRARQVQKCVREGDVQKLLMVPGLCHLLNPDNDCDVFAPRRFQRLRALFRPESP